MTYDGGRYLIDALTLRGSGAPTPRQMTSNVPTVTGSVFLLPCDDDPVELTPWFLAQPTDRPDGFRCLQFDGVYRARDVSPLKARLKYVAADGGHDVSAVDNPRSTWETVAPWIAI
jgi:hypothetical protein